MNINPKHPSKHLNLSNVGDKHTADAFRDLLQILSTMQEIIAKVINANAITYVAQTAAPTPDEGQFILWKDTTGAPTTPKAYIVTTQGGATYTFASEEVY